MYFYLSTKFEVSSVILASFRQGVILPPPLPTPQNEPLKSPPRLGLIKRQNKNPKKIFFQEAVVLECFEKSLFVLKNFI